MINVLENQECVSKLSIHTLNFRFWYISMYEIVSFKICLFQKLIFGKSPKTYGYISYYSYLLLMDSGYISFFSKSRFYTIKYTMKYFFFNCSFFNTGLLREWRDRETRFRFICISSLWKLAVLMYKDSSCGRIIKWYHCNIQ